MKPKRLGRYFLIALLLLVLVGAGVSWLVKATTATARPVDAWLTQIVERGSVRRTISATGTVTPVNLIQVGSQVSGTITRLHVDYNAVVRAGALLAEIDTSVLDAEVAQARAQRAGAQSALNLARSQEARQVSLFTQGYVSRADMEQAMTTSKNAQAALDQQQAALERAILGRDRATILSPVAGTIISREVSVGQTVAASLQTPVLFKIAQDLREMQIDASIAEADVGLMREGQPVRFTVDAFPDRVFDGKVRQIRNNHQVQQNVVTYTAVIAARNDELLLRPGMTAYIAVTVGERQDVVRIPNAALRYAPTATSPTPIERADRAANRRTVWRWDGSAEPQPMEVTLGLSDSRWTELADGAVKPGDRLVVGERKTSTSSGPKLF